MGLKSWSYIDHRWKITKVKTGCVSVMLRKKGLTSSVGKNNE